MALFRRIHYRNEVLPWPAVSLISANEVLAIDAQNYTGFERKRKYPTGERSHGLDIRHKNIETFTDERSTKFGGSSANAPHQS